MCGKANPPGSDTCVSCGARLVPVTGPLAQQPAPTLRPSAAETIAAKPTPPAAAPKPEPPLGPSDDWLSSLRGALPEQTAPEEEIPDWLRGEPSAPVEVEPPELDLAARLGGAQAAQPEAPDWLQQLAPKPSAPAVPAPAPVEQVPDWLQQLAPTPPKAAPPSPAPAAPPPGDQVPDWLKPFAPAAAVAASAQPAPAAPPSAEPEPRRMSPKPPVPPATAAPTPGEAEIPDWLKELAPTPAQAPSKPAAPTPAEAQVPDWLKPPAPTAPQPAEAEMPDWLKGLGPTPAPVEAKAPPPAFIEPAAAPVAAEAEVPDWLRELTATPAAPPPAGPALVAEQVPTVETPLWLAEISAQPTPAEAQIESPEWLKELQVQAPTELPVAPVQVPALAEEAPAEAAEELPDWLKELGPSGAPAARAPVFTGPPAPTPALQPEAIGLTTAPLPAWLQKLAPREVAPEAEKEPAETEGLLAGVHGPLPAAPIITQKATGERRPMRPEIPAADLSRAGTLQELLARGPARVVRREVQSRAQRLWFNTQRWFIFLVILAVALIPLLQPDWAVILVRAPLFKPATNHVFQSIQALKPDATVLVSFDYDASQAPEMDTQASVVLRHLAARKARVNVVSLYPTGPAVAEAVINQVNQTLTVTERVNIASLKYVPGQDMAVAFISGDVLTSSLVIELAATPETLRWWVEQMSALREPPVSQQPPPLLAGVSAAAEPMSQPYYQSEQIKGMLAGVPDATAYRLKLREVVKDDQTPLPSVLAPLASISLANAALVLLILIGGLVQLATGGRRR